MPRRPFAVVLMALPLLGIAARAEAQWYVAVYLGGNHTQSSTVSIEQPADGVSLQFHNVDFEARPLKAPQYYGYRFGRMFGSERRLGLEFEFIHMKAYAETDRQYDVTGNAGVYG